MGLGGSKEEANARDWGALQQNPQYGQVRSQAYSQSVEANYYGGRRPDSYNKGPEDIKSDHLKLSAVKVDFDIDVKNTKLEADKIRPNVFNLIFSVTSTVPVDVYVSFAAQITIDRQTGSMIGIKPKIPEDSRKFSFSSGTAMHPEGLPCQLNFQNYSFKELSRAYNDTIPLLIILERKTKMLGMLEKVIYFFQVQQKTLSPEVISKSKLIKLTQVLS